jgi:hypothetical protein
VPNVVRTGRVTGNPEVICTECLKSRFRYVQYDLGWLSAESPFNRSHRLGDPLSAMLLRLFAVLWQIKVDEAKAGGSSVRLVDPHDAVLMERACANFVIGGGVCVSLIDS